jgi:phosphoribosylamine---glycine ligase
MVKRELGDAGAKVVIEEILLGPEVSVLALIDGRNIYVLESAADHKRLGEHDTGPNTGGMGAFSPSGLLTESDLEMIERDVFVPIVDAMRREDVIFKGVLYAGMIMTAAGPKVLEFNCRMGDPETQPLMMRLKTDLIDVLEATIDGRLDEISLEWDRRASLCVVMASGGYPGPYEKGVPIEGLDEAAAISDVQVFHAGTAMGAGKEVVTAGGRVLGVTALGEDVHQAREKAYGAVRAISFKGAVVRGDIGMRVSNR